MRIFNSCWAPSPSLRAFKASRYSNSALGSGCFERFGIFAEMSLNRARFNVSFLNVFWTLFSRLEVVELLVEGVSSGTRPATGRESVACGFPPDDVPAPDWPALPESC